MSIYNQARWTLGQNIIRSRPNRLIVSTVYLKGQFQLFSSGQGTSVKEKEKNKNIWKKSKNF
jgi:hypothetical protein